MTSIVSIQDSKRYSTALRGVTIILILCNHCFGSFTRFVNPFGGIGVSLFLALSGYGLNMSYLWGGNFQTFWNKRMTKVWLPYFIIVSLYCLLSEVDLSNYIKQISLFQTSAPFWYIRYIFCCYVVFYFTSFIRKRLIRLAIFFILGLLTIFINGDEGQYGVSFFIGVILSEKQLFRYKERNNSKIIQLAMFLGGFLLLLIKHIPCFDSSFIWNNVFSSFAFAGFSLALILGLHYFKFFTNKIIVGFGIISYELYLVQMLFYWMIPDNHMLVVPVIIGSIMLAWLLNKIDQALSLRLSDKR